jgi:hypothetical protein
MDAYNAFCVHLGQAGPTSSRRPGVKDLPPTARTHPLPTECRACTRAHLYADARYVVVGPHGLGRSGGPTPSG